MAKQSKNDAWTKETARGVLATDGTTKAKIERAALALFSECGIDGVSIKELAAYANISEGGMYRYYPSKYNLAESMMLHIHKKLANLVRTIEKSDQSFEQKIRKLVMQYCALADDDWQLFSYHLLHLHHFPQLFAATSKATKKMDSPVTACADIIEAAMDDGIIPAGNMELLASMALGIVMQAAQSKIYLRINGPLSVYVPEFEKAILAVLGRS